MIASAAVALLACVATVSSGPLGNAVNSCATECKESSRFKYQPGTVYEYDYETDILTTVQGTAHEQSGVHFRTKASIQVQSPCEFILTLHDITLEDSDPRNVRKRTSAVNEVVFRDALQSAPLVFTFQDGRVEKLCTSGDREGWVLNVQRGILSAFQNSMEQIEHDHTVSETDVTGNCKALYKISKRSYGSVSISKSKDLLGCTDRQHLSSAFQSNGYRVPSDVQSLPLLKSTHDCEQTFNLDGHLVETACNEAHVFRPFSKQTNGAKTSVSQKLRFLRRHGNIVAHRGDTSRHTSMLFEHEHAIKKLETDRKDAEEILSTVCKHEDVRPDSASLFSRLVARLRSLDSFNLRELYQSVHNNRICKDKHERAKIFFTDAVPMVSTSGALALMRDLINKQEVTGVKSDAWMTTVAFIAKPTLQMLKEIKPVLDKNPRKQTVLAVSSLVHSYCRLNKECAYESEVQDITNVFVPMIDGKCSGDHDKVMLALKAIGNTGAAINAVSDLSGCVASESLPIETRVAAIQAFRRLPCTAERNALMNLLKDESADSELRIGAYLGVMECPTTTTISAARHLLENEKTNQVGSFIWTHLTNLRSTSDPLKQEIRSILENEPLKRTFNLDQRKFSRNYEGSIFMNSINTGAQVESNLIWSPKSYIPRSAMLNLTVDMFGESMNLLELGGRVEGMEKVIETFFGPDGHFRDAANALSKRKRRAVNDPIAKLHKLFNAKSEDAAKASMYMKIFGNELAYHDLHSFSPKSLKNEFNLLEILIKLATDHKVDFSKSAVFLDTSISVPTVAGLPLELSVKGVASVDMHIAGHADLRKGPKSLDIKGLVKPSGNVEITGFMTVGVAGVNPGLKMVAAMHSSTELDGAILLEEGKRVSFRLNMPRDKIEILSVETKFLLVGGSGEREQKMGTERLNKKLCSGPAVQKTLGVKFCGEVSMPKIVTGDNEPMFPMNGPSNMKMYILKTDKHSAYTFDLAFEKKKEAGHPVILAKASVNTPDSKIDRDIGFDFLLEGKDKQMEFSVRTPWKKVEIKGLLTSKRTLKAANIKLTIDKKRVWSVATEIQIDDRKLAKKYTPMIAINRPGSPEIKFVGSLLYKVKGGFNFNVELTNLFKKPLTLKGELSARGKSKYIYKLDAKTPLLISTVSGFAEKTIKRVASRLIVIYKTPGQKGQKMVFDSKIRDLSNKVVQKRNVKLALQSTQFPDYSTTLNIDANKSKKKAGVTFDLRYGAKKKDPLKRIFIKQTANYATKGAFSTLDYNMALVYKAKKINSKIKIDHRHSKDEMKHLATIEYTPGRAVKYDIILKRDLVKPIKLYSKIDLSYPDRTMSFSSNLDEISANNYHHEMIMQWQKAKQLKTVTNYRKRGIKHDVKSVINMHKMNPITLIASTVLDKTDFSASGSYEYNAQKYSTGIEYGYKFGDKALLKGAIDVLYPSRHITAEGQVSRVGNTLKQHVEVKWNADKNEKERFLMDGAIVNAKQKSVSLKVKYPGRFIALSLNHNIKANKYKSHAELSWSPKDKVSIDNVFEYTVTKFGFTLGNDINVTTSYKTLPTFGLEFNHKSVKDKHNSDLKMSWSPKKKKVPTATLR